MKRLLILAIAAGLAAACTQTEPPQAADATTATTADAPPAAPAPAPPSATPAATTGQTPAAAPQSTGQRAAAAPASSAPPPAAQPVAAPVAAPPPKPEPPPAPKFRDVTIPAGTSLSVTVLSNLASNASKVEDPVRGALAQPVVISGTTAIPASAELSGIVSDVKESGRVKGRASIGFRFDRAVVRGETHQIQTARVILEAGDTKKQDVKKGGIGAGVGAIVGGIAGGGSGAAIGAVTGGAATVLVTKGNEIEVPAGTVVNVLLQESLTVRVPLK